jgi:hypothetical protein
MTLIKIAVAALVAASLAACGGAKPTDTAAAPPAPAAAMPAAFTSASDVQFVPLDPKDTEKKGVLVHVLFGDLSGKGPVGFLAQLPPGFQAGPHAHDSDQYLVSIKGLYHEFADGQDVGKALETGGYVFLPAKVSHDNLCEAGGGPCLNYAYYPTGFSKNW